MVVFAHGSGSSRHSPRNRFVARILQESRLGTLLMDLLTPAEEAAEWESGELRFNISLLARRLMGALDWLETQPQSAELKTGCFGASTGAAAALVAAARRPRSVAAVVSRGGRPDLASPEDLHRVEAPTLLVVGSDDFPVIEMNRAALGQLRCQKKLVIIPRSDSPVRRTGGAGRSGAPGARVVRTASWRQYRRNTSRLIGLAIAGLFLGLGIQVHHLGSGGLLQSELLVRQWGIQGELFDGHGDRVFLLWAPDADVRRKLDSVVLLKIFVMGIGGHIAILVVDHLPVGLQIGSVEIDFARQKPALICPLNYVEDVFRLD